MKMAVSSLLAHKMRSILTMIGIIIGVGSVITVVAIGQGGEAMLKSQIVWRWEYDRIILYAL
jgi:putative ABC transport system permease protein